MMKKGIGSIIGIVIFILILLIALAVILSYIGDFESEGAQLSQAEINIYNHNNAKLQLAPTIHYIQGKSSQYSCTYTNNGTIYQFTVTVTCYYAPNITINIQNPSQITQTIEYVIISAGSPNTKYTNLVGTNQNGTPPNYQTLAYPNLVQLFEDYVGETIAPFNSLKLTIQQNNTGLYVPYKYYEVQIICKEGVSNAKHEYYYAYYQYGNYTLYYPYYGAPPYLPGTQYVPTDYKELPNKPVYPYGNIYIIIFNNWGDVYSSYISLQYP